MELIFPPGARRILSLRKIIPKKKTQIRKTHIHSLHSLILFKHLLSTCSGNAEMKEDSAPGAYRLVRLG